MEIFLVRHGIAEEPSDAQAEGRVDSQRRLTEEGREKTARMAKAFHKRVSWLDVIFHSPYARAVETANIFAEEFPEARMEEAKGLTPHDSAKGALHLMNGLGKEEHMMIVGHEPHLSTLASFLLTGKENPILEFKRAGVAGLDCDSAGRYCRLMFLLSPKWL